MIGYIKGKVLSAENGVVVLETGGIGYEVICSGAAYARLVSRGEGGVYTKLQVREDDISLFGFDTPEEKNMFLQLTSVSGVGPKVGIAILSGLNTADLAVAIATNDVKALTTVKGLGKKTAERIILELREKVSAIPPAAAAETGTPPVSGKISDTEEDAVTGLMSLGYTRAESIRAVKQAVAAGASTAEEIILSALRSM